MNILKEGNTFHERYELIRQIGVGGFAVVWKVRDLRTDTFLAIKIYAPEKGLDNTGVEEFKSDYQRTQHLRHPRLLTPNYFDICEGSPYLVMELCEQGSLENYLQKQSRFSEEQKKLLKERGMDDYSLVSLRNKVELREPSTQTRLVEKQYLSTEEVKQWADSSYIPEKAIAQILHDVAEALQYLHTRDPQILHRDIKTGNILVDDHNRYVITDFGISSRVKKTLRKATSHAGAMSVSYAPPERFGARPASVPAGDIFSLGVMLYELCENDVPWDGTGGMALLQGAPLPDLPDYYTGRFNKIVKSCMHPDHEQRPSAEKLVALANSFLQDGYWADVTFEEPVFVDKRKTTPMQAVTFEDAAPAASAPAAVEQHKKPKKKAGGIVAFFVVLVLGLGGVGGFLFMEGQQKQEGFRALINQGNLLYDTDKYLEAKNLYEDALALFPENPEVIQNIKNVDKFLELELADKMDSASYLLSKKKYEDAMGVLTRATNYKPEDEGIQNKLTEARFLHYRSEGSKFLKSRNYTDAEVSLKKALEYKSSDETAKTMLAQVHAAADQERLVKVNEDLLKAVKANNPHDIFAAIDAGGDVNLKDGSGIHLLYWAAYKSDAQVVKKLLIAGAKCEPKSNPIRIDNVWLGHPAVIAAYRGNQEMIASMLSQCKMNINAQEFDPTNNKTGWHALSAAAYAGHLALTKYLIANGSKVDLSGSTGRTPLLEAAKQGHTDIVTYLLSKGADPKVKDSEGHNAFSLATNNKIKDMVKQYGGGSFSYKNSFSSSDSKFSDFETKSRELKVAGGVFTVDAKSTGFCYDEGASFDVDKDKDFTIKVDVQWKGGKDGDAFGLMVGANDKESSYYAFQMNARGNVAVMELKNGNWSTLSKWQAGIANKGRNWNSLQVVREGSYMHFYVNNRKTASVKASAMHGNKFGLFVCNKQEVSFDNFSLEGASK